MTGEQLNESTKLSPTRRHVLKLAAGTTAAMTIGTTPVTAQQQTRQKWILETGDDIRSSPTVVDGTVFGGSEDGNLYAVDTDSGDQQWAFGTNDAVFSSPTVANGTVFVGSEDGNLYAVNTESGDQQWAFNTGAGIQNSSPTVMDNTVFVGSQDGNVYAVDVTTGDKKWAFETGGVGSDVNASPTAVNETVFIGSSDNNLYAIDAISGNEKWVFETNGEVVSSSSVENGTVFVGSGDGNIYAVDSDTGDQQWAFETDDAVFSSPTVVDGTVFVGSNDGNLYAVYADVRGSSEGSRVQLETLGHHDVDIPDDDGNEPNLFELKIDYPFEAVAGGEVTISVEAQANLNQISSFQINPAEQPDHINDLGDLTVSTTADTQVAEPGFIVYSELQDQVTVEWTGTIPETAEAGDTFTLAGDALNEAQDRQLFSRTVTVTDDPLEKYRNENGKIDDTGLLEAISDWREGKLEDTQLLELISEWRDAGGNVESLSTGSLPKIK